MEGCEKHPKKGGLCIEHGGQSYSKPCEVEGCWHLAKKGVYCTKHGGRYYCSVEGCEKHPVKGGLCLRHFTYAKVGENEELRGMS